MLEQVKRLEDEADVRTAPARGSVFGQGTDRYIAGINAAGIRSIEAGDQIQEAGLAAT